MVISFIVNKVFDGWSPWDTRVGGSEETVIEVSKRLAALGHSVSVYHNGKHGEYEGVQYKDHSEFTAGDVTVNVNFPEFNTGGKQIYLTSLASHSVNLDHFDVVLAISHYAKRNTGLKHPDVRVLSLGYDPEQIKPGKKVLKQCFYGSSPDRGLHVLLDAWPQVHEVHPDATLIITYGGEIDLPGVINLGEVDEDTMNDIYATSDVWCHPCTGIELYCMTGKKAQVAGCIPVIIPNMALADTVERGFKTDQAGYAATLIEVLAIEEKFRHIIRKDVIAHANASTWDECAASLLKVIEDVVK